MGLPDYLGPTTATARTSGISNASVANASNYLGSDIDNATNLDGIADIEWIWQYSTAPTASKTLSLHILYSYDGTNYEEGGVGVNPLPHTIIRAVSPPADTNTHRVCFSVPIEPYKFKLLVRNVDTAQTVTTTVNIKTRKDAQISD